MVALLRLDVVIEVDAADPPVREYVRSRGQWLERSLADVNAAVGELLTRLARTMHCFLEIAQSRGVRGPGLKAP